MKTLVIRRPTMFSAIPKRSILAITVGGVGMMNLTQGDTGLVMAIL